MKSLLTFLTFFLCISCCKKANDIRQDITNVKIEKEFDDNVITISESTSGMETGTWRESIIFDLTQYDTFQANVDRVNDITLKGFSFKITNYVGPENAIMTNTTLGFGDRVIPVNQDINLLSASNNGTIFEIGNEEDFQAFVDILKADYKITLNLSGTVNEQPVNFDIEFIADSTIYIGIV